jgi:hypothetical protein
MPHPHLSGEEIEQRGQALYEERIRPKVEAGNEGRICTIDVETGDYEIGETILETTGRILARKPDAALWSLRIGYEAVYTFGGSLEPSKR